MQPIYQNIEDKIEPENTRLQKAYDIGKRLMNYGWEQVKDVNNPVNYQSVVSGSWELMRCWSSLDAAVHAYDLNSNYLEAAGAFVLCYGASRLGQLKARAFSDLAKKAIKEAEKYVDKKLGSKAKKEVEALEDIPVGNMVYLHEGSESNDEILLSLVAGFISAHTETRIFRKISKIKPLLKKLPKYSSLKFLYQGIENFLD